MAPNTRIRLIPLLLLCMSGASLAETMPALQVAPELLRGPVGVAPTSPAVAPAATRPAALAESVAKPAAVSPPPPRQAPAPADVPALVPVAMPP
ncbi:MAG: LPS-assembly protein LptD, partial [Thauera sp.]|nr:LPS-assembly protein LptD [Thauera sp.]